MNYDVLILEDDSQLGGLLVDFLATENLTSHWAKDGIEGLEAMEENSFQLALVDVMMPRMDGFTFAEKVKQKGKQLPLLFCTARSLKHDKLHGFSLGADDYIVKPFDEDELVCRVKAILRRAHATGVSTCDKPVKLGKFLYDIQRYELTINGEKTRLTKKENKILSLLWRKKGEVVSREEALVEVYGKNDYFLGRSFDVFISKLRKILREDPSIEIENVFGVGFILRSRETETSRS